MILESFHHKLIDRDLDTMTDSTVCPFNMSCKGKYNSWVMFALIFVDITVKYNFIFYLLGDNAKRLLSMKQFPICIPIINVYK